MKKKIAVISMGVKLNGEKGYSRFRYIGDFLSDAGYQVDLITTTFQHWEKAQRDIDAIKKEDYKFQLKFIYEPGYRKNIDLRRIRSHSIAAKILQKLLEKEGDYDLIYCEIPPNDVALAAAEYAKKKGIPFVPDVNDLWPEAMRMVLDIPVVSDILFYPLQRDAEKVYSLVSGIIGTSDEYRDRPLKIRSWMFPEKLFMWEMKLQSLTEAWKNTDRKSRNQKESSGSPMQEPSVPAMISVLWCWQARSFWTGECLRSNSGFWEGAP